VKKPVGGVVRVFSPDGKLLATTGEKGALRLWEVASGRPLATSQEWGADGSLVNSLAFSPDGKTLATGGIHQVKLWDVTGRREEGHLAGFTGTVWGLAFTADGRLLITGSDGDPIKLWDVASRREMVHLDQSRDTVAPLLIAPDGRSLITGGGEGLFTLWDLTTRRAVASVSEGLPQGERGIALSPDGKTLAITERNAISLWSLPAQQEVATLRGHTGKVWSVAFSPDGNTLASAGIDGTVRLWRAASLQEGPGP
jgi:WD40 repeat protein